MKINVLDSSIFNRISAGEVVERPYSVVKELVENSIDAGANDIIISIKSGGISYINVTDNGCGIENDDILTAFLPHATSKVSSIEDLNTISTLGFRGEALASIANVSMVTLKSKSCEDEVCKQVEISGGNIESNTECSGNIGTSITVENIFYNTPARKKFLKSSKSEERAISNLVLRLILANPDLSIKYFVDSKKIYHSFGNGLESALNTVYNRETTKKMIYLENSYGAFKVNGFIGDYNLAKGNRTFQTIILNGRYIQSPLISTAVANAYGEYLMKRTYPIFVLDIVMPFDKVDINVHPAKTEVRFLNDKEMFSFIYHSVKKCLEESVLAKKYEVSCAIESTNSENNEINKNCNTVIEIEKPQEHKSNINMSSFSKLLNKDNSNQFSSNSSILFNDKKPVENFDYLNNKIIENTENSSSIIKNDTIYNKNEESIINNNQNKNTFDKQMEIDKQFTGKVIGQLFSTYLLIEDNDTMYMIDQHAVHERIIYNNLMNKDKELITQELLIPYILNTSYTEAEFLSDNLEVLKEIGIDIEEFGNLCFKINKVPIELSKINLEKFFNSLLKDNNYTSIKVKDVLKDKLMQLACKSAIKGGMTLSKEQIDKLITYFVENGMPLKCPHGRPTVIKMTKNEIEKLFKRIV